MIAKITANTLCLGRFSKSLSKGTCNGYDWGINVDNDGYSRLNQVDIKKAYVSEKATLSLGLVYGGVNIIQSKIFGKIEYIAASDEEDDMVIGFDECVVGNSATIRVYQNWDDAIPSLIMPLTEYIEKSKDDLKFVKKLIGAKNER